MKIVQLAITDSDYAQSLRNLLLRDGKHQVRLVECPDLGLEGVVVIDERRFHSLAPLDSDAERFVLITRKGADNLSRVWNAGIRHVVFDEDSPNTAQLAVIAAELRLPKRPPAPKPGRPLALGEKHRAPCTPLIPVLGQPVRCRRCGPKNADTEL